MDGYMAAWLEFASETKSFLAIESIRDAKSFFVEEAGHQFLHCAIVVNNQNQWRVWIYNGLL